MSRMSKKYIGKGETRTFTYLQVACKHFMKQAKTEKEGQFYGLMATMVFAAFTLEAYLNHLGSLRFEQWDEIERGMSVKGKLALLRETFGLDYDNRKRPFHTVSQLVNYRNRIVHGKTELTTTLIPNSNSKILRMRPATKWEIMTTLGNALKFRQDVNKIIDYLHTNTGIDPMPPGYFGMSEGYDEVG